MPPVISLSGSITLDSIARVEREVAPSLGQPELVIDLGSVTEIDSAAVSLLLHWQRGAMGAGQKIALRNPPDSLLSLAALYGVEEFLPVARD